MLQIIRKSKSSDAYFGDVVWDGQYVCRSMERIDDAIEVGIYKTRLDKSPHLGYVCPHLQVPKRDLIAGGDAGLRIHVANFLKQLKGCIAVGQSVSNDSLNHSQMAFDSLMLLLPSSFRTSVSSEIPA